MQKVEGSSPFSRFNPRPDRDLRRRTVRGRLFAVGGPVGGPRPLRQFTFRLVDRTSHRVLAGRTDRDGRFLMRVPPGMYVLSIAGMVLVTKSGDEPLRYSPLRVAVRETLRPHLIVTNPLWA